MTASRSLRLCVGCALRRPLLEHWEPLAVILMVRLVFFQGSWTVQGVLISVQENVCICTHTRRWPLLETHQPMYGSVRNSAVFVSDYRVLKKPHGAEHKSRATHTLITHTARGVCFLCVCVCVCVCVCGCIQKSRTHTHTARCVCLPSLPTSYPPTTILISTEVYQRETMRERWFVRPKPRPCRP